MALTLADLHASPDHYLQSFDGESALFVPMDRAAYHRSIFLDARISPAAGGVMRLPVATLAGSAPAPAATGWIFHIAHCGSTLLARALDRIDRNLVLREPLALRQVAVQGLAAALPVVAAMLGKRYRADLPTIVKANVPVNFLLPDIAAIDAQVRAILLHLPLPDYLLAILRSDNHREWLRRVTTQLAAYLGDVGPLTDAERAAALWRAQMRAFAKATASLPGARSLDAETFFAEPAWVLRRAADHLGVALLDREIEAAVAGPLFSTYSKDPQQKFDNQARIARRAALEPELAAEIAQAERWLAENGGSTVEIAAIAKVDLMA